MNVGDGSYLSQSQRQVEVRKVDAARESLSSESFLLAQAGSGDMPLRSHDLKFHKDEVVDHGQINRMQLPKGWAEVPQGPSSNQIGSRSLYKFQPPDKSDVCLGFYYRGLQMNEDDGRKFRSVLDKPPHVLSTSEIGTLSETLQDMADPSVVSILYARTEDLNGKRVLKVEGRFIESKKDFQDIFVDASEKRDGRAVQEVFVQGTGEAYLRYSKAGKDSIKTIQWKSTSKPPSTSSLI